MINSIGIQFLNTIQKITERLDRRVKNAIVLICFLILISTFSFGYIRFDSNPNKYMIGGTIITLIITVFSMDKRIEQIKFNKFVFVPMVLFGMGIMAIEMLHPVGEGYLTYAIDLAIIYPVFYIIWANRKDIFTLYILISVSVIIIGIASFVYCFYLSFNGELGILYGRVSGFTGNPNLLGRLGIIIIIASEYLLLNNKNKIVYILILSACIGIGITYIVLSVSRTAMLALTLCELSLLVFEIKSIKHANHNSWNVFKMAIIIAVVIVVFALGTKMDDINVKQKQEQKAAEAVVETISALGTEGVEYESIIVSVAEDDSTELDKIKERFWGEEDINGLSSGRIRIWKVYINNLSWFGRDDMDTLREELPGNREVRAHNNILDYLFRCGYIVGGFYILFYLAIIMSGMVLLFHRSYKASYLFFVIAIVEVYAIYAMLDITTLPFCRIVPCIFFYSITPIMCRRKKSKESKKY